MEIEICTSIEWWRVYGGCDGASDDEIRMILNAIWARVEAGDAVVHGALRDRRTCHGWNGANLFTRKHGGIGTFDKVSDSEWNEAVSAYDAAMAPA